MARTNPKARGKGKAKGKKNISKLFVPKEWDFEHLAFKVTYKQFVSKMQNRLGKKGFTRPKVERLWATCIQEKWDAWTTDLSAEDKRTALMRALEQVTNCGGFDADEYWALENENKEEFENNTGRNRQDKTLIHGETGLKVPNIQKSFCKISKMCRYKKFINILITNNGSELVRRENAEAAWDFVVKRRWDEWVKHPHGLTLEEAQVELEKALDKDGRFGPQSENLVDKYWRSKTDQSQELARASEAMETENMDMQDTDVESHSKTEMFAQEFSTQTTFTSIFDTTFHAETGLMIPDFGPHFRRFIAFYRYKPFLACLDEVNGHVVEREKAEAAWQFLVQAKYDQWVASGGGNLGKGKDASIELAKALDQVVGHSSSGMDKYWANRIKNQGVGSAEGLSGGRWTRSSKGKGMVPDNAFEDEDEGQVKFNELLDFNTMIFPFRPKD